jgi:hypothetical protein
VGSRSIFEEGSSNMKQSLAGLVLAVCVCTAGCINPEVAPQRDVRELILDARTTVDRHGDAVWPGLSSAPFGILLVDDGSERLFCHDGSPDGFEMTGSDPILSCPTGSRAASFPSDMQQTFPAIDDLPIIVLGTPESTRKSVDDWVLTIFHEHFHQLQFSWEGYYPGVAALGLGGGDESGMWMLEYEFPYQLRRVANAFRNMADELIKALEARGTAEFADATRSYRIARERARSEVSAEDWRYIELQLWQEGAARWTEAAIAASSDRFAQAGVDAEERVTRELTVLNLREHRRAALYSIGAGEVMLLEAGGMDWRASYWSEPFSLGPQLEKLVAR